MLSGAARIPAVYLWLVLALGAACAQGTPSASSGAPAPPPAATSAAAPAPAAGAGPTAAAAAVERLRVPYVAVSVTQLPAWVAQEAGTFAREGLDVSLEHIPTGSTLVQAMVAGEAQFGIAGSEAPISASLNG